MRIKVMARIALFASALSWLGPEVLAAVGKTAGFHEVSQAGSAQYTIPIWTPAGTNGIHPPLAVTYNHARDNGILGMGFEISGFSVVSRCPKTIAQDGSVGRVEMAATDGYCLDGNRLRLKTGLYGAANSTYATELETFSQIIAKGAVGASGPSWFEVWRKDGLIYEYGNSTTSQIEQPGGAVRLWVVNAIRDRSGNRVEFTYFEDVVNGSFHPDSIKYSTNVGQGITTAPYQISFIYEARLDSIHGNYVAGGPERELQRLARIETRHSGSLVRIYRFQYETSGGSGGRSRLASIQECSTSIAAIDCFYATQFTWTSNGGTLLSEQNPSQSLITPHLIDMDGDGRDDLVYTSGSGSGTWRFRVPSHLFARCADAVIT